MGKTGIYKITNPINKQFYIGSASNNFLKRFWQHRRLLHLNKNPCKYLQRIYNKNKNVNFTFEILELCDKQNCIKKEQYYIDTLNPKYNLCKIAGSSLGRKPSKQAAKNHFEAQREFSDKQVILMFKLYNKNVRIKNIAKLIKCKPNNVSSIINKRLKYMLVKKKYNLKVKNKIDRHKGNFLIKTPNGEQIIVNNLTKYAKENNLNPANLNKCANKKYKHHKNYKVEKIN